MAPVSAFDGDFVKFYAAATRGFNDPETVVTSGTLVSRMTPDSPTHQRELRGSDTRVMVACVCFRTVDIHAH